MARALVIGKAQTCAWVTRPVRLPQEQGGPTIDDGGAQIALNDLARVLLGVKRADRIRATELADRAGIPTMNEIIVRQSAIAAWKAINIPNAALENVLVRYDSRTRGGLSDLRRPISTNCVAAVNMAKVWNSSEALRQASSLAEARKTAARLSKEVRHV